MAKGKIIFRRFGGRTIPIFVKGATSFNLETHTAKAVTNIRAIRAAKRSGKSIAMPVARTPGTRGLWSERAYKKHAATRSKVAGISIARILKQLERK